MLSKIILFQEANKMYYNGFKRLFRFAGHRLATSPKALELAGCKAEAYSKTFQTFRIELLQKKCSRKKILR